MNSYAAKIKQKGARMLMMHAAFPIQEYLLNEEPFRNLEKECLKDIIIPFVGKREDFLFPYELFSNAVHHLRKQGRLVRTERVINSLIDAGIPGERIDTTRISRTDETK